MENLTINSMQKTVKCKNGRTMKNVLFFPTKGKVVKGVLKLQLGGITEVDDATYKLAKIGMKVELPKR